MTALFEGIDLVILPVSDLAAACAPFERIGLVVSPVVQPAGRPTRFRTVPVGGAENLFGIEILTNTESPPAGVDKGLSTIVLRVADMATALATLAERGIQASSIPINRPDGTKRMDLAMLPDLPDAATRIYLEQQADSNADRLAAFTGGKAHTMPLKRLDHLAAVPVDLERACKFWDEVLGVPTVGEVVSPTIVVRQLKIGDAILELLGPSSPDSPIRQRPPGLGSSCSFEVDDLEAVLAQARGAGFEVPDSRVGTLPGTRVTTVPSDQMSGINLQLLQYV